MSVREVTITLLGVKEKQGFSNQQMDNINEDFSFDEDGDTFMKEKKDAPDQGAKPIRRPKSSGPGNFRNKHYQNAYGNYRGGYGPQGEYGPPTGPQAELGFGPIANFGPNPHFGPRGGPNFGMGPNFGPRPNFMWGRGFGPDGPPSRNEHPAVRYLARCGLPKESVKNLPRALLQMMEPSFCGLCNFDLESFAASRMHYTSKVHQKNQKKWLMGNMGPHGEMSHREQARQAALRVPVKARNLYCELCDVHITSQSHADSHYAGKPHRAIVEGRKLAKNEVLLRRGMEARLEMLIRREKKHIKPEDILKKEELKVAKPVTPELYCDICKTSVTCSEQMTMHLNGKRHLSKEKQHILQMMTGQTDAPAGDNFDGEEAEGADENATAGDEGAGDATDDPQDFDWGNGSGKWDEPTATNE